MVNEKRYPFITKFPQNNGLIPIINKGEPIRFTPADKKDRLRLIRETGSPIIQQRITIPSINKIN